MPRHAGAIPLIASLTFTALTFGALALAQPSPQEPGKSIGSIATEGHLIVFTLNDGALGKANLFDLAGRSLRFTPDGAGYRVKTEALKWDADFGSELTGPQLTLKNFAFPFSGKSWTALSVGLTGSIVFGESGGGGRGGRGGGVSIARFDQLREAGRNLVNGQPAICVFMKPRMSGQRFAKELPDRLELTWTLTEPYGNIQDFSWTPTVNRFQAVLSKDGSVEMSYEKMAARDAIVGLYPAIAGASEKAIASISGDSHPALAAHMDVTKVTLASLDGLLLKVTLDLRGPALAEGDPEVAGLAYRIYFDRPARAATPRAHAVWTIRGMGRGRGNQSGEANRYLASGSGISRNVRVAGDSLTVQGVLPEGFRAGDRITVSADVAQGRGGAGRNPEAAMQIAPHEVALAGIRDPELDLSALKESDGPFPVAYESFHYLALPNSRDLSCTVINALGDHFDMLAYYSDFRVDNQEAGTPSNGPLGGGPGGGAVSGIGARQSGLASYCTQGRFQWSFVQPVYVGSNQMQEYPPDGLTDTNTHNIATYTHQIAERTSDGKLLPYDYAMSQIGHEMGHRWSAFVSAKVGNETIPLGDGAHWVMGLQAPVAFPYQRPTEASAMGGGVWQDNYDGTFTQLDDNYYVPATGWSYLDLYLMGLIAPAEVPDFFILRNLTPAGRDANGHPMFKAQRTKLTVDNVIAVEGPRSPDVDHAQKKFNTGIVVIAEHGKKPTPELIHRANAIRLRWMDYWETTTGHRSSMTTDVPAAAAKPRAR